MIETYTNGAVDLRVLEGCEIPKGVGLILFFGRSGGASGSVRAGERAPDGEGGGSVGSAQPRV